MVWILNDRILLLCTRTFYSKLWKLDQKVWFWNGKMQDGHPKGPKTFKIQTICLWTYFWPFRIATSCFVFGFPLFVPRCFESNFICDFLVDNGSWLGVVPEADSSEHSSRADTKETSGSQRQNLRTPHSLHSPRSNLCVSTKMLERLVSNVQWGFEYQTRTIFKTSKVGWMENCKVFKMPFLNQNFC